MENSQLGELMIKNIIDPEIIEFLPEEESKRIFKTKKGYLLKGFLNANKLFIETNEDLTAYPMRIRIGNVVSDENLDRMVDTMKRSKRPSKISDLDIVNSTCNLSCEYCSVKDRSKDEVYKLPSIEQIKPIFELNDIKSCNFIGGESMTEWEQMKALLTFIDTETSTKKISIFTNAKLLDKAKLDFFNNLSKNVEFYIPATTDFTSKNHYSVDALYDRYSDFLPYNKMMFTINLLVDYKPFDADDTLIKLAEIVNKDNFDLLINSVLDNFSEENLLLQLQNFQNIIKSKHINDIHLDYDRPEFIGFTCSGFNFSACSEGYSTCSMATLDNKIKPYKNLDDVQKIVQQQITSRCKGCDAFDNDELCEYYIKNRKCVKLNEFNCYSCPDLGRCSFLRCTYRIALQDEKDTNEIPIKLGCLNRLLSRIIIEFLNEKDKDLLNRNDMWYLKEYENN
jgi:hypothetical protein